MFIYEIFLFESDQWPKVASTREVEEFVKTAHYNEMDFNEGDLLNRIARFRDYVLKKVHISKLNIEWAINNDMATEYSERSSNTSPPIVYDPIAKSIIDGTHRVMAAHMRGDKTILAYVGYHVDPNWSPDEIEEDFNPKSDPTIMSATKKDGNISRSAADKMVDPRGNFAKPKYYYKKP